MSRAKPKWDRLYTPEEYDKASVIYEIHKSRVKSFKVAHETGRMLVVMREGRVADDGTRAHSVYRIFKFERATYTYNWEEVMPVAIKALETEQVKILGRLFETVECIRKYQNMACGKPMKPGEDMRSRMYRDAKLSKELRKELEKYRPAVAQIAHDAEARFIEGFENGFSGWINANSGALTFHAGRATSCASEAYDMTVKAQGEPGPETHNHHWPDCLNYLAFASRIARIQSEGRD